MNLPDFLVIGAGKSGTTSVDNYLKQHPDIFITAVKEPNFFALEGFQFLKPEEDKGQFFHFPWSVTTLDAYLELFKDAPAHSMKGETSPMYLYHENAPANIRKYVPDVKLIAILRQPADRIFSRYLHLAQEQRVPGAGLQDIFVRESVWWQRNDLVKEGFYYKHLSRYFKLFPRENIMVVLYEDLLTKRDETMNAIFSFIGVSNNIQIDTKTELNQSGLPKNRLIDGIIGKRSPIFSTFSRITPGLYAKVKTNKRISHYLNKLRKKNMNKPGFDPELRKRITSEVYADDIRNLQELLHRDLSHWL